MKADVLAQLGMTRLRLPIPTAKLHIAHGAARALRDQRTQPAVWDALIEWIERTDLESEILEGLCPLMLIDATEACSSADLRRAIRWPSVLSDIFLSRAYKSRTLVNSWAKSHSGEAPSLFRTEALEEELGKGHIVPPILRRRLERLEERSRRPVMKQWGYEFERVIRRIGSDTATTGHLSYFAGTDRQRESGQFVTRRGHVARSAYLRTLALAFDRWGMPEESARAEAMYASPVDFSFLRILPTAAPSWAVALHHTQAKTVTELQESIAATAHNLLASERNVLLHLNMPLKSSDTYEADAELISCLCAGEHEPPEILFRMHDHLPGSVYVDRSHDDSFLTSIEQPAGGGDSVLPALLPAVAKTVGYFHTDLVGRMPYLPASYLPAAAISAHPRVGGAELQYEGNCVGAFHYWSWAWSPMHNKRLGTPQGVAVCLSQQCVDSVLAVPNMRLVRAWRGTVLSRTSNYGDWEETVHHGVL